MPRSLFVIIMCDSGSIRGTMGSNGISISVMLKSESNRRSISLAMNRENHRPVLFFFYY